MSANVKVRTLGVFKELFGDKLLKIRVKKRATVKDVVEKLADSLPSESKRLLADSEIKDLLWLNALILVNGKEISVLNGPKTIVLDGDEIFFLPVSHGG